LQFKGFGVFFDLELAIVILRDEQRFCDDKASMESATTAGWVCPVLSALAVKSRVIADRMPRFQGSQIRLNETF
jgi:hypothetical protein